MNVEELNVLSLRQKPDFVQTPCVRSLSERALCYVRAGYPVHFSGLAGTDKTTLAMHVAAELGRPVVLIHGDDEFGSSDLVGGQLGYRSIRVVDNFIHSVVKTQENVSKTWVDHRLTNSCKYGFTVIYDEFNRSRPEANNVLLGVLEERLLELPAGRVRERHLQVHPGFSIIFTSNPEEYAGVHKTQDALLDRMITVTVSQYHRETEVGIIAAKSGLDAEDAARIVDIVRDFRCLGIHQTKPTDGQAGRRSACPDAGRGPPGAVGHGQREAVAPPRAGALGPPARRDRGQARRDRREGAAADGAGQRCRAGRGRVGDGRRRTVGSGRRRGDVGGPRPQDQGPGDLLLKGR
ncbi:MAG TPA: gas vesicle protein GvpN [Isosphaeraceae bacterium]|nr:gas vesicle protein GvpN [Isosphaeraceae bacterium]